MSEPEQDVQIEIQKTLVSINDVTIKIKKELTMILDLIREDGSLGAAVRDANQVLFKVAQDSGIDVSVEPAEIEEDEERSNNHLVPITSDLITKKLSALVEHMKERSQ